jgi:hypothetical protein
MGVSTIHILHGIATPSNFYGEIEDCTPTAAVQAMLGVPAGFDDAASGAWRADPHQDAERPRYVRVDFAQEDACLSAGRQCL